MAETSGTLRMEAERKSNFKFRSQAKNRLYTRGSQTVQLAQPTPSAVYTTVVKKNKVMKT